MPRELKSIDVQFVSFVDKAANQRKFFLTKSAEQQPEPTFTKSVRIVKDDNDPKQLVYGIVYEPDVEDAHGDFATAEAIEKAAHDFLTKYRQIDTQHDFEAGAGEVVESYIAPADMEIASESITKGTWILVTKATDEIWEAIQKGEYTGYSLAGLAETVEHDDEPQLKSFFQAMKSFFTKGTVVTKGAVADKYNKNRKHREFWAAQDALNSILFDWDNWNSSGLIVDADKIREALQDFVDIAQEVLIAEDIVKAMGERPVAIQKAGKKISTENMNDIDAAISALQSLKARVSDEEEEDEVMKAEDIQKAITAALEPVVKEVEELKKTVTPQEPPAADDTAAIVQDAVAKALEPIVKDIEAIKTARGISKQVQEPVPAPINKSEGPAYSRYFG